MLLKTIHQLNEWLNSQDINTAAWGLGEAKTVENLWAEIVEGETQLQDNPPLRVVQIVNVIIRRGDYLLVEAAQEFGDHQQRRRDLPPAEKLKPGENPVDGAIRCLQEELQVGPAYVEVLAAPPEAESVIRESPSYPGLPTQYRLYRVEVKVTGLPEADFSTSESPHDDGDPVRSHHWRWEYQMTVSDKGQSVDQ